MAQQTVFPSKLSIHAGLRGFGMGNGRKGDKDGLGLALLGTVFTWITLASIALLESRYKIKAELLPPKDS